MKTVHLDTAGHCRMVTGLKAAADGLLARVSHARRSVRNDCRRLLRLDGRDADICEAHTCAVYQRGLVIA